MSKVGDGAVQKYFSAFHPEVEALEPDVQPEVIVGKIGLMHEIPNDLLDMYL